MYACIIRETFVLSVFRRVFHSILKLELCRHACRRQDQIIPTCRYGKNMPTTALRITQVITLGSRDLVQIRWGPDVNCCLNLTIFKNIGPCCTKFKQNVTKIKLKEFGFDQYLCLWIWETWFLAPFIFVAENSAALQAYNTVHFVTVKSLPMKVLFQDCLFFESFHTNKSIHFLKANVSRNLNSPESGWSRQEDAQNLRQVLHQVLY